MKKVTYLKVGGAVLGLLMIIGAFFKWIVFTGVGAGASWRSFRLFGLHIYSSDRLMGLNSFPILAGVGFTILVVMCDKSRYAAMLAALVAGASFLLTAYNLIYWKLYPLPPNRWIEIHPGLYLTLITSVLGLALVFLIRKFSTPMST